MGWLLFAIIITSYVGLVVANMIKLNEAGVLEGRLKIVLLLPFVHFILTPIGLLYKSIKEGISFIPSYFGRICETGKTIKENTKSQCKKRY